MKDIKKDPFDEYIKNLPPTKQELGYAWSAAIGLQDVDDLKPSEYLYETAKKSINGDISIDQAGELIDSYYENKNDRLESKARTEEADKVSARIAKLLSDKSFTFSPAQYVAIHKELFKGIYSHAGKIRDYNISKKEWVLDGDSVPYGGVLDLRETLEYDFSVERNFSFNGLTMDETIHHLAVFVSRLWQIHVFGEGNTRTTAVFFIKYLRMLGFDVDNDLFADNSWYFRNALVRANYNNIRKGVYETTEFLEKFLRNLLLGDSNELQNREMHINAISVLEECNYTSDPINDPINDPIKLSERERTIVNLLRKEPTLTRAEMAEKIGCSDSTVKRTLQAMTQKDIIKRVGSNKKGQWVILIEQN